MAASFSVNLPLAMISSKSSPPLQILETLISTLEGLALLSNDVITLLVLEELVHLHDVGVVLEEGG